jgi:hypothetical protein
LSALFWIVLWLIMWFVARAAGQANWILALAISIVVVLEVTLNEPIREGIACFVRKQKTFRNRSDTPVKKCEGYLMGYWEQGWEGRIDFTLPIEGIDHPFPLERGQRLTTYAEDGKVLWSGVLCFVKRRWWDQPKLPYGVWSDVKPVGVSYARWMEWSAHKPPLKATVQIEEPPEQ